MIDEARNRPAVLLNWTALPILLGGGWGLVFGPPGVRWWSIGLIVVSMLVQIVARILMARPFGGRARRN